jgi:multidrug transporter EmrE-like cation transporter
MKPSQPSLQKIEKHAQPPALGGWFGFGDQLFLLKSYKHGDLTKVYPIARGTAPLLVGLFSLVVLGVELSNAKLFSIIIIGVSLISLAFGQKSHGQKRHSASTLALITGLFIASYSLIDGLGARLAGSSLGFFVFWP